jgi:hypothetical protein
MTAQEMSEKIVARVSTDKRGVGVSLFELVDECGDEAKGELCLEFQPNLVLWTNVSETFAEAFKLAHPRIRVAVLPPFLVLTEPKVLALPIARHVRPYKRPRWLPVALFPLKRAASEA